MKMAKCSNEWKWGLATQHSVRCYHLHLTTFALAKVKWAAGRVNPQADGGGTFPERQCPRRLNVCSDLGVGLACPDQSFRLESNAYLFGAMCVSLWLTTLLIDVRPLPLPPPLSWPIDYYSCFHPFFLCSPNKATSEQSNEFWSIMASGGLACVKYLTFFCNLLFAVSFVN